ncbi:hypothetical protein CDD81_3536 [Ophiocordyceps australis]|uniref:Zn(2)-C6 fungal-type domain-containing protein n=1 Tax=Ophiocordyceps australis TaxID=1399860 RepID=A0A2C5XUW9_9HYPO|nr:hypothetical protein CDD81_3536 [Ophiocordyceps australis]
MFGTWKYDPETDEVQNLRRAYDPITARSSQHQACNRCHAKKLKCSGEKQGCDRCSAIGHVCEYTRSSSRSSRRVKKSGSRNSNDGPRGGRDDSVSPPPRRDQALSSSTGIPAATPSLSSTEDQPKNQVSYSMESQQTVFDMNALSTAVPQDSAACPQQPPPSMLDSQQHAMGPYPAFAPQPWLAGGDDMATTTTSAMDPGYLADMYGLGANFQPYDSYHVFDDYSNFEAQYWPPQ